MKKFSRLSAATLAAITATSCITAVANAESEEYKHRRSIRFDVRCRSYCGNRCNCIS